jgi:hypothetical protein
MAVSTFSFLGGEDGVDALRSICHIMDYIEKNQPQESCSALYSSIHPYIYIYIYAQHNISSTTQIYMSTICAIHYPHHVSPFTVYIVIVVITDLNSTSCSFLHENINFSKNGTVFPFRVFILHSPPTLIWIHSVVVCSRELRYYNYAHPLCCIVFCATVTNRLLHLVVFSFRITSPLRPRVMICRVGGEIPYLDSGWLLSSQEWLRFFTTIQAHRDFHFTRRGYWYTAACFPFLLEWYIHTPLGCMRVSNPIPYHSTILSLHDSVFFLAWNQSYLKVQPS